MNNERSMEFMRRWRELERDSARIDYERSVLSAEIRSEFSDGTSGDVEFQKWCEVEFSLNQFKSYELLCRARCIKVVSDEKVWRLCGGFRGIRLIIDLPVEVQVSVIEAVKQTGKSPRTVMKEMGLIPSGTKIFHASPDERTARLQSDAIALAEFIAKTIGDGAPSDIRSVIDRYVSVRIKRRAA